MSAGYNSPSLAKMEAPMRREARHKRKFSLARILGDPFALATISIAILAWLIAFISAILSSINQYARNPFPNFAWWTVAYYLCCIIGVIVMVALDSVYNYHVAAVAFLAYALFLSTSAADNTIYDSNGPHQAAASGFILLSVVAMVWIFYFGSQPSASHRGFIDSFALHPSTHPNSPHPSRHLSNNQFSQRNPSFLTAPQQHSRNHLNGLETSSPETRFPEAGNQTNRNSPLPQQRGFNNGPTSPQTYGPNVGAANAARQSSGTDTNAPTEYPYKARAIYSYEANPDDANEISFMKHEVLDVSDVSGRWWQAKKTTGETGIAPSNYLILL